MGYTLLFPKVISRNSSSPPVIFAIIGGKGAGKHAGTYDGRLLTDNYPLGRKPISAIFLRVAYSLQTTDRIGDNLLRRTAGGLSGEFRIGFFMTIN